MKTTLSPFLFLTVLLVSCGGLAQKTHPPLVFALNLSGTTVSLSVVKGAEPVVAFASLAPQESRALTKVPVSDGLVLRQRTDGDNTSRDWSDPSGAAYPWRFQEGHLYAIVVDPLGQAELFDLPEQYNSNPKLCLVNVTATTLSQVQAAAAWAKNVKIYAQDVAPVVPSEFYSFEPKTLGLFWQTMTQVGDGTYKAAQGLDGKPLRQSFESGRYYLFLAGEGSVRDLTPTLD